MQDVKLQRVTVIGGGLAGSECAWQLARRGVPVTLREMKPQQALARAQDGPVRGAGVLQLVALGQPGERHRSAARGAAARCSSVILGCADTHRVPAGDALAVEREAFSAAVTRSVREAPGVEVVPGEVDRLPEGVVVVATGPLTSDALTKDLERYVGEKLYFYDSIAPIVSGDSIDMNIAFRASRYGKGGGDDYLNLPMNKEEYYRFIAEVKAGQKLQPHSFEEPRYFEGCLPIEVMADRGDETLAYGPMKPVGLKDPRTGEEPYAVVQLRMEDKAGTSWNMVGFQTRLTWGEQKRIFTTCVPGLAQAEFLRMGQIHRNTFIDSPRLLGRDLSLKAEPRLFFAGQITGVEGYVESAACGLPDGAGGVRAADGARVRPAAGHDGAGLALPSRDGRGAPAGP